MFGIRAPGGILSTQAAQVDAYRFTRGLAWRLHQACLRVLDGAELAAVEPVSAGVVLQKARGHAVRARHVVLCTGYETQRWCPQRVARNRSSYAMVTDSLPRFPPAWRRLLLWESARPYLYARSTSDGRMTVGGEDDAVDIPARRDKRLNRKARRLREKMQALFPAALPATAFCWTGTFWPISFPLFQGSWC